MLERRKVNAATLLHRRQFLIAPRPCAELAHWTNVKLDNDLYAHAHPDLPVTRASASGIQLVLFGYMIDAHRPQADNEAILRSLASAGDRDRIIRGTFPLAGRWALLILAPNSRTFITDAFGLRQLVYTVSVDNRGWYASDAKLIADLLQFKPDPTAQAFLDLIKHKMGMREYYLPGSSTRYAEIKHLPPNYFLDLNDQSRHRFFPCDPILEQPFEDIVSRAATMLGNIVEGAHRRFPLASALTAGMDSRLVLAATKPFSTDVFYYTVAHPIRVKDRNRPESDPDIEVAKRLSAKLGLQHHLLPGYASIAGTEFAEVLEGHTSIPHTFFGEWVYALFQGLPEQRVALSGNCSEAARLKWHRKATLRTVSVDKIADLYGWKLGRIKFVHSAVDEWLQTAKPSCAATGFELLDLLYWEFKMGRWLAQSLIEHDIAQEVLCPFNCRELITTMMATAWNDRSFRTNFRLQRAMLDTLWPECLSEPWKTDRGVRKVKNQVKAHLRTKNFGQGYPTSFLHTLPRSWSI